MAQTAIWPSSGSDRLSVPESLSDIRYSFSVSLEDEASGGISLYLPTGGRISGLDIDGKAVPDEKYGKTVWPLTQKHTIAKGMLNGGTHRITYDIYGADSGSSFLISGPVNASGTKLYKIWDEAVEIVSTVRRGNLRILYWNIQNGIWADQAAGYANFREWVKRYDPDICIWCECGSYKKTSGYGSLPKNERYFPKGWKEFAKSYGHDYCVISAVRDNFPQVVTSKYPLTTIQKIASTGTSRPIWHGAGHHRINVRGKEIDIVTTHPWPFKWGYEVHKDKKARKASADNHDGDRYRQFELDYILGKTIKNPEYAGVRDWIMAGDFNSISRIDNWYYRLAVDAGEFLAQDVMRNNSGLLDVMAEQHPGRFISSTSGGRRRIDYIYMSPSLYGHVAGAASLCDSHTSPTYAGISNYWYPSDHLPILVDMNL